MAIQRLEIDGFGQVELNQVAFRRDGRVEAQCALDKTDFAENPAENGMLLAVDRVKRTVVLPKADNITTKSMPVALNYTSEHMYDERANALKDFNLKPGEFLPRLGYLSVGDIFTTNCLSRNDEDFSDDAAVATAAVADTLAATPVYGGVSDDGTIALTKTAPENGPVLKVIESTTMPDGQFALKFQVIAA